MAQETVKKCVHGKPYGESCRKCCDEVWMSLYGMCAMHGQRAGAKVCPGVECNGKSVNCPKPEK